MTPGVEPPPPLRVKFIAFDTVPPATDPALSVAAPVPLVRVYENPSVPALPVHEKPVMVAMLKTVVAPLLWVRVIPPAPNEIARVLVLLELKMPQVKVKPASASVPWVRLNMLVLVAPCESELPSVTVIPAPSTIMLLNVLPALVSVPVPLSVICPEKL